MNRLLFASLALLLTSISCAADTCTIKGEIINRDSKVLLIRPTSIGFRSFINDPQKVLITDGKFVHTFSFKHFEAYELIFEDEMEKGSWIPIKFFPADGIVEFRLYPKDEYKKNTITGGELNDQYQKYLLLNASIFDTRRDELMKVQEQLIRTDEYESAGYKEWLTKLRAVKSGEHDAKVPIYQKLEELQKTYARYTDKAKALFINPYDSLLEAELEWKYDYIRQNISFVSYYLIWTDVEMQMKNVSAIAKLVTGVFPSYQLKYPDHIYTSHLASQIAGIKTIMVGNKYINIKATSVAGDTVQLSDAIGNKVALLDFWGSWCGPCIAKSRLVVPVYSQYKDRGFTVVGIAREFNNLDAVKNRLKKERFSWLNLVDLDDKQNIWSSYGISNGVGLMVLVDKDGTILSIDPKIEELELILKKKLR